jgi:hypothetical protein
MLEDSATEIIMRQYSEVGGLGVYATHSAWRGGREGRSEAKKTCVVVGRATKGGEQQVCWAAIDI